MFEIARQYGSAEAAIGQREASLLFADLRSSTSLATVLEPFHANELLNQVLDCMAVAVTESAGHIIDYFGDGLAAMWNAPADQLDHAQLACGAAVRMLERLEALSEKWADVTERQLTFGIGLHTGLVHVGNTGSRDRTKYGPRGVNVNLASRVEGAAKKIGLPLILTEATAKRVLNDVQIRRICQAALSGFDEPMTLYAISTDVTDTHTLEAWRLYDAALQYFESGQWKQSLEQLASINAANANVPVRFLAEQVELAIARSHRRRQSDQSNSIPCGVIGL